MEFCDEKGLCVGNAYFQHKNLHKYARVTRGQDGVEVKRMIDQVVMKNDMLRYMQDVSGVRRLGRGLSYHHVVLRKVRFLWHGLRER